MIRFCLNLLHRLLPHLPGRWRLAILSNLVHHTTQDEREVFHLKLIGPCRGVAIDVGANYGLYSHALQRLYRQVVAFEPNRKIAAPLIDAAYPNVRLIHEALSSQSGQATLHIPTSNGVLLSGWASLDPQCDEVKADSWQTLEVAVNTLDSHQFQEVGFIKIDVEGLELEVLRGAEATIRNSHPHLLIEVRPDHVAEVREILAQWRYSETTLQALGGPPGSPQNYLFVPA